MPFGLIAAVAIVAIIGAVVVRIVEMSLAHHEKIMRIEHGLPLKDGAVSDAAKKDFEDGYEYGAN